LIGWLIGWLVAIGRLTVVDSLSGPTHSFIHSLSAAHDAPIPSLPPRNTTTTSVSKTDGALFDEWHAGTGAS